MVDALIDKRIREQHKDSVQSSPFATDQEVALQSPPFHWIRASDYPLAIQSESSILSASEVGTIRQEASNHWQSTTSSSRFTLQRPGNSEVHVADLKKAQAILNRSLVEIIYPMIHQAYGLQGLCVYDALVIRYNATKVALNNSTGASQPLHRDLGLISVNIRLNDEFEGGGTFFENQMRESSCLPLKPAHVGHCLMHKSSERHAGSATTQGVRDVLIVFVMSQTQVPFVAEWKQARVYCTECGAQNVLDCLIRHYHKAVEADPLDGEAWLHLGTALMVQGDLGTELEAIQSCMEALEALEKASVHTPCDSRVYNNIALVLGRLSEAGSNMDYAMAQEDAFIKSYGLLRTSARAGCDVSVEWNKVLLNYGLFIANQDRFSQACCILQQMTPPEEPDTSQQTFDDGQRLLRYCEQRKRVA